jgi:hypothetical protein
LDTLSLHDALPIFDESCIATVVMDNPGSCKAIRQFIRFAGVKLFLLPKSAPDRNPIEQILVKPRHLLRTPHALSKLSALQLLEHSLHSLATNAQVISRFSRLCVKLIAVMHSGVGRARSILKTGI